jgi:hypothetical protein
MSTNCDFFLRIRNGSGFRYDITHSPTIREWYEKFCKKIGLGHGQAPTAAQRLKFERDMDNHFFPGGIYELPRLERNFRFDTENIFPPIYVFNGRRYGYAMWRDKVIEEGT